MIYLRLFYEFFKAGLFAVGGGMATVPFLQEMSDTTGWFTQGQLADMIAVSESTPGPVGVNMATYVGFTTAGISGAVVATIGLVMPSIIIILLVAAILQSFKNNRFVKSGFYGLRPASVGLIAVAVFTIGKIAFVGDGFDYHKIVLAVIILALTRWVKLTRKWHPIVFIAIGAVAGVVFKF